MTWFMLFIAGIMETFWAYQLKCSEGFTKLMPSVLTIVGMCISFYLLSLSLKHLPLGLAYAVWTGIGTVGTVILGILLLKEPINPLKIICILMIVIGIIGLNITSTKP